jgi:hypothetical protein
MDPEDERRAEYGNRMQPRGVVMPRPRLFFSHSTKDDMPGWQRLTKLVKGLAKDY